MHIGSVDKAFDKPFDEDDAAYREQCAAEARNLKSTVIVGYLNMAGYTPHEDQVLRLHAAGP